ncbi:MAG: non-heme iron oxygenase ferredoxin subunit [Armatimonadetes bacterium]|nr:MAG: non-heme iron oxygenase ferredoxin subunit [Armatimonadota bacterium]
MSRHSIGALDTFPEGAGTKIEIGSATIAVFRVEDCVYAIADRCSHAEASLSEGELFGFEIECPRHGAEFDIRTGAVCSLPATKPVASYTTEITNGEVVLTIEDEASDE